MLIQLYRETSTDAEQRNRFRDRSVSRESINRIFQLPRGVGESRNDNRWKVGNMETCSFVVFLLSPAGEYVDRALSALYWLPNRRRTERDVAEYWTRGISTISRYVEFPLSRNVYQLFYQLSNYFTAVCNAFSITDEHKAEILAIFQRIIQRRFRGKPS